MKYIKPSTEIIRLSIKNGIMENMGLLNGASAEDGERRDPNNVRKHFMAFDDDDDYGNIQNAGSHTSLWDEE